MPEAILTTHSRPVRVLSIAGSRGDIHNAVRLYTHIWGGGADAIMPLPTSTKERELLKHSLQSYNPDLLLLHNDVPSEWKSAFRKWTPASVQRISSDDVTATTNGTERLRLSGGSIPHIIAVLDDAAPKYIPEDIYLRIPNRYGFGLDISQLYFGIPSTVYTSFLSSQMHAKAIELREDQIENIGVWLAARHFTTPWSLTLQKVTQAPQHQLMLAGRTALEDMRLDSGRSLQLFVDDGTSLHIPCAFWNTSRINRRTNKLLVSQENIIRVLKALLTTYSSSGGPHELLVIIEKEARTAGGLYGRIRREVNRYRPGLPVALYYRGFEYVEGRGSVRWRVAYTESKVSGERGDVRFTPQAPIGHRSEKRVYGFDSEIEVEAGRKYSLPLNSISAALLRNPEDRIAAAREKRGGAGWPWLYRTPAVRPADQGIAGAIKVGDECRVHLHRPDYVVEQQLLERGCSMRASPHTRYARGFVRRIGGLSKAIGMLHKKGLLVLKSLIHAVRRQDRKTGLVWDHLAGMIGRDWGLDHKNGRELLKQHLPQLLESELIRRGVTVTCPDCRLSSWYSLQAIDERVECPGCTKLSLLPDDSEVTYCFMPNELAARFITEGGRAVLMTAGVLRALDRTAIVQFGGFLTHIGESEPFGEIDLISLSYRRVIVAECKDIYEVTPDRVEEVLESVESTIATAAEIGVDHIIVGLGVDGNPGPLLTELRNKQAELDAVGESFDIVLNGEVWVSDEDEFMEPTKVSFRDDVHELSGSQNRFGTVAHSIGFGGEGSWSDRKLIQSSIEDRTLE